MELWAGFECTLNRVGAEFRDQQSTGDRHARMQCRRALPDLGVAAFRYRVARDDLITPADQTAAELMVLRNRATRPIAGLLHHGSGPLATSLISSDFAHGLAAHARRTAESYPWLECWTPIDDAAITRLDCSMPLRASAAPQLAAIRLSHTADFHLAAVKLPTVPPHSFEMRSGPVPGVF